MKIRTDWRDRLSVIVGARDRAPLSKAAGLSATFLRDVIERNATPHLKNAEKLSFALGIPVTDWFIETESPPAVVPPYGVGEAASLFRQDMPRDVPILGTASCGDDGLFEFNDGAPIDFARRPARIAGLSDVYALLVVGSSMSPWRDEGELVYVQARRQPLVGDYAVIQLHPKSERDTMPAAFIKRFMGRNSERIKLLQYKPEKEFTLPLSRVKDLQRIIPWSELLGA